jgi:hypothetical protein
LRHVEPTDHGVVAWLHLQRALEDIGYAPESLAPALTAILRHNLPDQIVDVKQEPITMLLMLCDHIQEWGRPRIGPDPIAQTIVEALRFSESPDLKQKVRVHELQIDGLDPVFLPRREVLQKTCESCVKHKANCSRQHPTRSSGEQADQAASDTNIEAEGAEYCFRIHTKFDPSRIEFRLPHIDSREGDFEPGISWLLFCRDLQCLHFKDGGLPFEMDIVLKHTPARIWSMLPWRPLEMDLLEEYASSYRSAAFLCQWIEYARQGARGIEYQGNRETGEESFFIRLGTLDRPLQRGLADEIWKDFFKWKWHWLGQRFLNTSLGSWFPELD